jgi:hypothetical protein
MFAALSVISLGRLRQGYTESTSCIALDLSKKRAVPQPLFARDGVHVLQGHRSRKLSHYLLRPSGRHFKRAPQYA